MNSWRSSLACSWLTSPARIENLLPPAQMTRRGARPLRKSFNIAYSMPEQHDKNLRNDVAIFTRIVKEAGLRAN